MDPLALAKLSLKPQDPAQQARAEAEDVANQFEAVFVKTLVGALRSTASVGGEEGGMFGDGPGADTYAGWFDQNVATSSPRAAGSGSRPRSSPTWSGTVSSTRTRRPRPRSGALRPRNI